MAKIKYLVIHCTATPEGMRVSPETLRGWFLKQPPAGKGWSKVGYRTYIDLDGVAHDLLEYNMDDYLHWDEVTYGARGYNAEAVHVSYGGGCDRDMKPKDTRTYKQSRALEYYVKNALSYLPDIKVLGHNQINSGKACPSFDVPEWLEHICIPQENIFRTAVSSLRVNMANPYDFSKEFLLNQISHL